MTSPTPRCPGCLHTAARHKRNGGCRSCDCIQSSAPPHIQPNPTPDKNMRPHSRACGWQSHEHGADCASDCPACHTPAPQPEAHQQYTDSNHVSQSAGSDIPATQELETGLKALVSWYNPVKHHNCEVPDICRQGMYERVMGLVAAITNVPAQPTPLAQDGAQVEVPGGFKVRAKEILIECAQVNRKGGDFIMVADYLAALEAEAATLIATATREAYERGQRDEHDVTYKMLSAAYASGRISQEALSYLHYLGEARLDQLKKKRLAERGNGEVNNG